MFNFLHLNGKKIKEFIVVKGHLQWSHFPLSLCPVLESLVLFANNVNGLPKIKFNCAAPL